MRPVREPSLADQVIRNARSITHAPHVLEVEQWASDWLGHAWLAADPADEAPEHQLCQAVGDQVSRRPTPHGLAAAAAFRRLAASDDAAMLGDAVEVAGRTQPSPSWMDAGAFDPTAAWKATDVWESESVLFVEYDGPVPHTLMAQILTVGGTVVGKLALLRVGAAAAWNDMREPDEVPMPIGEVPVATALAELAGALRLTDLSLPRQNDVDFVELRALAWSRCRDHLAATPGPLSSSRAPLTRDERERLLSAFADETGDLLAGPEDGSPTARPGSKPQTAIGGIGQETRDSLAQLFLEYGESDLTSGPLAWSPDWVRLFLTDWLPGKGILDAAQRAALPTVLRRWIRFALQHRGVDEPWITPVVDAVDAFLPEFAAAFDDSGAWDPAKQVITALMTRDVDPSDPDALDRAVHGRDPD